MHLSYATEKSCLCWVRSYIALLSELPQGLSSEEKVSAFLTREAKRGVAAATQSQALNAVVVLYRKVLDMPLAEVEALLGAVEDVAHPKPRAKPWSACELLSASRPPFGLPLAGCLRFARLSPPWLAGLVTQGRCGKHNCLRAWLCATIERSEIASRRLPEGWQSQQLA